MADSASNWSSPGTLALLGAAGGFLDPNGGPSAAMHLGIQGMMAGNQMRQQRTQNEMLKNKLAKQMQIGEYMKGIAAKHNGNTQGMLQEMIGTGDPTIMQHAAKLAGSLKGQYLKSQAPDGTGAYQFANSLGQVTPTGIPLPPEKLAFQNLGNQTVALNPMTGQPVTSYAQGISPGQSAQLGQSADHFNMSHALAQQNSALERYKAMQPKLVDGAYMYPPSEQNPQGGMIKTPAYTAPKGSDAEKSRMSERVRNTLGDDTEDLIRKATGSGIGAVVDYGASVVGATTKGAEANATLKLRASTLAGNMPRFEGPQSDADRKYYLEMAGDLANPSKTTKEKLLALKELRRIHNLADTSGSVKSSVTPGASDSGWNVQRID